MLEFATKLASIILFDIVLSGDNAVVIALATRGLEESKRKNAIMIGTAGAIILRVILMLIAVQLLMLPYVKIVGSLLLLYIAYDLLKTDTDEDAHIKESGGSYFSAIRTILMADLVMSLDNVLAIAGTADGHFGLAVIGLAVSIPIIIFGSQVIIKLMDKYPILIWIGAAMIAYTAGKMFVEDHAIAKFVDGLVPNISHTPAVPLIFGAILVLGKLLVNRLQGSNKTVNS
ncbi:TerC family protein [Vagococcus zengguangii]|uniref:TerC family protein n=1 Tax=Vagococcus zengguangii TaxID=2571750 RepID=A0A4D7CUW5_9ENTE|nr:TerC family protein [Vagococcus zengguangii]QCI87193.1 TerC family protein [Vagococcus zengguangii]TLG80697.1 TerC family protein [Vagococcus zengguangii]